MATTMAPRSEHGPVLQSPASAVVVTTMSGLPCAAAAEAAARQAKKPRPAKHCFDDRVKNTKRVMMLMLSRHYIKNNSTGTAKMDTLAGERSP